MLNGNTKLYMHVPVSLRVLLCYIVFRDAVYDFLQL